MDGFDKMEILIGKSTSGIISTQYLNMAADCTKYTVLGKMTFSHYNKNTVKASTLMILPYIY